MSEIRPDLLTLRSHAVIWISIVDMRFLLMNRHRKRWGHLHCMWYNEQLRVSNKWIHFMSFSLIHLLPQITWYYCMTNEQCSTSRLCGGFCGNKNKVISETSEVWGIQFECQLSYPYLYINIVNNVTIYIMSLLLLLLLKSIWKYDIKIRIKGLWIIISVYFAIEPVTSKS